MIKPQNNIILFDGNCSFCNKNVQFIIKHDRDKIFKFTSLHSEYAHQLFQTIPHNNLTDSILYFEDGKVYDRSTAALKINRHLSKPWNYTYFLIIIPRFIRDAIYDMIAKYRYSWFGKNDSCMIPTSDLKDRFL